MAAGDIAILQVVGNYGGNVVLNDLCFQDTTDDPAWFAALADQFKTAMSGQWGMHRPTTYTVPYIRVIDANPGTNVTQIVSGDGMLDGQDAGSGGAALCALVMSFTTAMKGRANRGRIYLAPFLAADIVAGYWGADPQLEATNIADALSSYFFASGSPSYVLGVGHRVGAAKPVLVTSLEPITGALIRNIVYTQRRREVGRGA